MADVLGRVLIWCGGGIVGTVNLRIAALSMIHGLFKLGNIQLTWLF